MMVYLLKAKNLILGEHARSKKVNKHIIYSFLIKGYAIGVQFALVPLTLHYLDKFHYGVWLVLASMLEWFSYFDVGISHGLRNRLSEALANDDVVLGRKFISTAYALVTCIFVGCIIIFAGVNPYIDWGAVMNVPPGTGEGLISELGDTVMFVFTFFCIRFILSILTAVLYAKQEPSISNLAGTLGSTLALVLIFLLSRYVEHSFFWVAAIYSAAPVLMFALFTIFIFGFRYRNLRPSFKLIDFSYSRHLLGLGVKFFIIHMAMLIMFGSANLVLTQLYGPEYVTVYNVAHKYFTIVIMVNGIITLTYWSPFTEAFVKRDFEWIRNSVRRLELISLYLVGVLIISAVVADPLIRLWVGDVVAIPDSLKLAFVAFVSIQLLAAPYNIFINGTGKVRLQLYLALVSIVITIPLSILFARIFDAGAASVVIAMICSTLPAAIIYRIQYKKLINDQATGVWSR